METKNYLIDYTRLKLGDILLTAEDTKSSKAIRKATKSDFSHAMINVAQGGCIHALPDGGVQSVNLQRILFSDPKHVKVLRVTTAPSESDLQMLCDYARTQIGKQYSVRDAAFSGAKGKRVSNRQYCSRLVAESYAYARINLVENPQYCTPGDLDKSKILEKVEVTVREATPKEVEFAYSSDPIASQTSIIDQNFAKIRKIAGADIQTEEQLLSFLIENKKFDNDFSSIVRRSGYLDMWKGEISKNNWRYNINELIKIKFLIDDFEKFCQNEISEANKLMNRFNDMLHLYIEIYHRYDLEYCSMMVELYKNLVSMTQMRLGTFQQALAELKR